MNNKSDPKISMVPGLAIIGMLLTGVAGLVHAFLHGSSVSLLAAVVAFGTLLYFSFR